MSWPEGYGQSLPMGRAKYAARRDLGMPGLRPSPRSWSDPLGPGRDGGFRRFRSLACRVPVEERSILCVCESYQDGSVAFDPGVSFEARFLRVGYSNVEG